MKALNRHHLYKLIAAQLAVLAPLFIILPSWLSVYWLVLMLWCIVIEKKSWSAPSTILTMPVAVLGIIGLVLSFRNLFAVEVFVGFFLIAYSLKMLEVKKRDDGVLIALISFVALASVFLFYQTFFVVAYALFALCVVFVAWSSLYRLRRITLRQELKSAALTLGVSVPLMLMMFIIMPRLGPLWSMPTQSQTGTTGFSDSMSPGDISSLTESNAVAFRVTFESEVIPPPSQRYWRALILDGFDGRTWRQKNAWQYWRMNKTPTSRPNPNWNMQYDSEQTTYDYSVLLEPHQQPWLFSLMAPVRAQASSLDLVFTEDATLAAKRKVAGRVQYSVSSQASYLFSPKNLKAEDRQRNLSLPKRGNERARKWAQTLRIQAGSTHNSEANRAVINEVLSFFNQRFTYTLQPPAIPQGVVDGFLFDTQRGFCEHFSSSFVFLMRAAGIPARVVVGYQGGELNPIEQYLIVRQRDAHAWAEVWLSDEGWVRIDPTASVAPSRIESGLRSALSDNDQELVGGINMGAVAWLQLRIDTLSYTWQRLVINYDSNSQQAFFTRFLGGGDYWRIALFFVGGISLLLLLIYLFNKIPARDTVCTPTTRYYRIHLKKLAKHGYIKAAGETPLQFYQRVALANPHWRTHLEQIANRYIQLTYAEPSASELGEFKRMCKQWRP